MGLMSRIFKRKSAAEVIDSPEKLAAVMGYTLDTYTGKPITTQSAMQLTTVFGCIRVLSESLGMLPCRLYEERKGQRSAAIKHPVYKLLAYQPNDYMTPQEFWELLVNCLCLRGNFYAYKIYTFGQVSELLPIDPAAVTPSLTENYQVEYKVTFKDGTSRTLSQNEIWHVRLFTLDGVNGLNPIAYAREAIALGLATEEHGSRMFKNGTVLSGVLKTDQQLSDAAFKRLKEQFQDNHQGLANAHKPAILEMGLGWQPTSLSAEDSQFLETRKFQRDEICAIYRVPPHLVANIEKMTLNNIEHLGLSFVNYSLVPYITRIEHRIRVGLLNEDERARYYGKFNTGALLRGDLKSRYESYGKGIQWGILSPNDCRALEDMNDREGGDIYLTPLNMTTNPEQTQE